MARKRVPSYRAERALLFCALALVFGSVAGVAESRFPERVAADFCEQDGFGARLAPSGWRKLAPYVGWEVEPAWDEIVVVSGYEVQPARSTDAEATVPVRYSVLARVGGRGVVEKAEEETLELRLLRLEGEWRIVGPPHPPHLFDHVVDRAELASSLSPEADAYLSNSKLLWQLLRGAGWDVPYRPTRELLGAGEFFAVAVPAVGDLVLYLRKGVPYHAGVYRGDGQVVSATLTEGVIRADLNAFPGEVRYLRIFADTPRIAAETETSRTVPTLKEKDRPTPGAGSEPQSGKDESGR
ncbi:MAG: hypothetical protein KatS3mg076_0831 [Candidatus Binatia bacterium]|nr:MAG: hypothetical protein KatS3mg076_0831 [Candidatus Binatia bacterium]